MNTLKASEYLPSSVGILLIHVSTDKKILHFESQLKSVQIDPFLLMAIPWTKHLNEIILTARLKHLRTAIRKQRLF